jgi:hypothetical protein
MTQILLFMNVSCYLNHIIALYKEATTISCFTRINHEVTTIIIIEALTTLVLSK